MTFVAADPLDRLARKIDFSGDCWEWLAYRNPDGYGMAWLGSRKDGAMRLAHRVVFEVAVGPVDAGLEVDHLCGNRGCVNPDHLEPVTHEENARRSEGWAVHGTKTHCPQGHPYDPANTYRYGGSRHCKMCRREAHRRFKTRRHQPVGVSLTSG